MLLFEAVTEDHGVVQGQGKLEDAGHGIGHEGDFSQQEIAAQVQNHGRNKGQDKHRDLGVSL